MGVLVGGFDFDDAGEVDGDDGGDVGYAKLVGSDVGFVGQMLVQHVKEMLGAQQAAFGQCGDLCVIVGPWQGAVHHAG